MNSEQMINFVNTMVFHQTQRHLRDIEISILEGSWDGKTYADIADCHNYSSLYLTQDIGPKFWKMLSKIFQEDIKKCNFRTGLERHFKDFISNNTHLSIQSKSLATDHLATDHLEIPPTQTSVISPEPIDPKPTSRLDWGEAPDVSHCLGRESELKSLDLILNRVLEPSLSQCCRLLSILGMGGMGKTVLSRQLAQTVLTDFEGGVIWRSLRNRPDAHAIVKDWIQHLCPQASSLTSATFSQDLLYLLKYLTQHRCLLILDDFHAVLEVGSSSGTYRSSYEEYGLLLRCLADTEHQSCLIITSRIKPQGLGVREGPHAPVRSFRALGFQAQNTMELLKIKGCYGFDQAMIESLCTYYGGNPFALKSFAATVRELTDGNVADFLAHFNPCGFHLSEVEEMLHQQLCDLTPLEQQLMSHFAACPHPMTLAQLISTYLISTQHCDVPKQALMLTVQSLMRRSLIEQKHQTWFVQPYILDYTKKYYKSLYSETSRERIGA